VSTPPRSRIEIFEDLHSIGFSVWFDEGPVAEAVARSSFIHVSLPLQYERIPRLVELLAELHAAAIPDAAELHAAAMALGAPRPKALILDELHALGLSVWFDERNTVQVALEGAVPIAQFPRLVELLAELHAAALATPDPEGGRD